MGKSEEGAPKTYSLRITEQASKNIDHITGYIAFFKHEPLNAIRVGDEISEPLTVLKRIRISFVNAKKSPPETKLTEKRFASAG